jgi:tetratricopeptide (TPR) repeat protein
MEGFSIRQMKQLPMAAMAVCIAQAVSFAQAQPTPDLMAVMQTFCQALGVTCEYCHTAPRGSGQAEPKKDIARAMMAMMREINAKIGVATGKTASEVATVQCMTCHRGVAIPRQLSEILSRTIREKGVAAAVAQYRELRKQYFGGQSYDLREGTLLTLGQQLAASKPDDAIALLELNVEYYPQSARSYAALGYAYTRKFDDATALKYLEKAVALDPDNGVIRGQLEQLQSYQRRK